LQHAASVTTEPEFLPWRLVSRDHLNPEGSERLFRVGLMPATADPIIWRAGDLAEFEMPDGQRRTYSIASVPAEGQLDLLVREVRAADGTLGRGTAWLLRDLSVQDIIRARVKPHAPFHSAGSTGPILLVGAGSGLAGLRPHIVEAHDSGRPVWLIYGERHCDRDSRLCRELQSWHQMRRIYRLNMAISQSVKTQGRYVQDIVAQYATEIEAHLGADGTVMMCGSQAMGDAVTAALTQVLGSGWMATAYRAGRVRAALF